MCDACRWRHGNSGHEQAGCVFVCSRGHVLFLCALFFAYSCDQKGDICVMCVADVTKWCKWACFMYLGVRAMCCFFLSCHLLFRVLSLGLDCVLIKFSFFIVMYFLRNHKRLICTS